MKIIITALIIIGSLIRSTDSFVTNPNRNLASRTTAARSNTVSPRWASTLDKKDVEEKVATTTSTSKKMDDDNNNIDHSSDNDNDNDNDKDGTSFGERITNSGVASAAAMATVSSSSPVNSIIKMNE